MMLGFDVVGLAVELKHGGEAAAEDDEGDGEKHQAVKQAQHQQRHQNQEEIPAIRESVLVQFILST